MTGLQLPSPSPRYRVTVHSSSLVPCRGVALGCTSLSVPWRRRSFQCRRNLATNTEHARGSTLVTVHAAFTWSSATWLVSLLDTGRPELRVHGPRCLQVH